MKIVCLVALCLLAGTQASFLDDLKNAFSNVGTALTNTVHAVGDQAKIVGQNLLETAKQQGSDLASQALQSELSVFLGWWKSFLLYVHKTWNVLFNLNIKYWT